MSGIRTLLLNTWGLPHAILSWEGAICLLYQEKAIVLEDYEETVSSPSTAYFIPAVMQLKVPVKGYKKGVKFSRINVFTRDSFSCQYCGERKSMKDLNYDHVLPRKQGGRTNWENIVTSCYKCNEKKGGRTPEEARMKLLKRPAKPHSLPLHAVFIHSMDVPAPWVPYLDFSKAYKHGDGFYMLGGVAA